MARMISFPRVGGGTAQGWLAEAADPKASGVVVVHEWWGLEAYARDACDRLARAGFAALAPDLYGGLVVPYDEPAAAEAAMDALDLARETDQAVRGAAQRLAEEGGRVGLAGFSLGGMVAIAGAARIPEVAAAVCFYGLAPEGVAAPGEVRVPLQCHFAAQDDWCTPAAVAALEEELRAAGRRFEIHRYPGRHSFMNSRRPEVYDASAAELAWERCLSFLRRHLAG